jgi:hypothetical protein
MLGFVIKLACFDTCPKLSESKTVFNIFGSKIKEWWDRDQLLEDQVKPLTFVANTGESSSESSRFFICLRIYFLLAVKDTCNGYFTNYCYFFIK